MTVTCVMQNLMIKWKYGNIHTVDPIREDRFLLLFFAARRLCSSVPVSVPFFYLFLSFFSRVLICVLAATWHLHAPEMWDQSGNVMEGNVSFCFYLHKASCLRSWSFFRQRAHTGKSAFFHHSKLLYIRVWFVCLFTWVASSFNRQFGKMRLITKTRLKSTTVLSPRWHWPCPNTFLSA